MRLFFALLLSLTLLSCNEKIVQLPETTTKDITEILDVSTIYMFYDEATGTAEFNRKNMISSTNWLVAIDKRITLKQALPHLQYLYNKRHDDGMHSNDKARSYLSCSNPEIKNLAFIDYTDVAYSNKDAADFITNFFVDKTDTDVAKHYYINIKSADAIVIGNQTEVNTFNQAEFIAYLKQITQNTSVDFNLYTSYNENLTFQDYITIKTLLLDIKKDHIKIANEEIIYN